MQTNPTFLLCKKPRPEDRGISIATRITREGQRLVSAFVLLRTEFKNDLFVFFRVDAANRGLHIIASLGTVNDIGEIPANQVFTAFARQLSKLRAVLGRDPALLLPLLNRLIGDAHLPRHIGERGKVRNSSVECGVHMFCVVEGCAPILVQDRLVTQVLIQLSQGFLAGIFTL